MGKGDQRTKRGKIVRGTYGVSRKRKKNKPAYVATKPKTEAVEKQATQKKAKPTTKKAAKTTVKKTAAKKKTSTKKTTAKKSSGKTSKKAK